MADCAASGVVHSATDISHRNTAIIVSGPAAADTLNAACPLDLSLAAFRWGRDAHVFGKIEIILYRVEEDTFRVECWRSFAEYAFGNARRRRGGCLALRGGCLKGFEGGRGYPAFFIQASSYKPSQPPISPSARENPRGRSRESRPPARA